MKKTPEQKQFEQVKNKFYSLISQMDEVLALMPKKGDTSSECQRALIQDDIIQLSRSINGIELQDFTPNEYSEDFKLSYS